MIASHSSLMTWLKCPISCAPLVFFLCVSTKVDKGNVSIYNSMTNTSNIWECTLYREKICFCNIGEFTEQLTTYNSYCTVYFSLCLRLLRLPLNKGLNEEMNERILMLQITHFKVVKLIVSIFPRISSRAWGELCPEGQRCVWGCSLLLLCCFPLPQHYTTQWTHLPHRCSVWLWLLHGYHGDERASPNVAPGLHQTPGNPSEAYVLIKGCVCCASVWFQRAGGKWAPLLPLCCHNPHSSSWKWHTLQCEPESAAGEKYPPADQTRCLSVHCVWQIWPCSL